MLLLYNTGISLYFTIIYLASFFNKKAKLWIEGRKDSAVIRYSESIWFHFASLGEFEQGRPVLERVKSVFPTVKIVITFFSPSGYEIRKDTPLADAVYYLPLDTQKNARNFIDTINPKFAVFTKYEYWYHFFNELHKNKTPLYIISGIFRPQQVFFEWYGSLHRSILSCVSYFFLQDESSKKLLQNIGLNNATVSGDTRFDRVWANAENAVPVPFIAEFKNEHKLFIAGSTWPEDEKLLACLPTLYPDWKFIFAPHEIGSEKITKLFYLFPGGLVTRYSDIDKLKSPLGSSNILVIDNIGLLSSLYQYADIAYIGGGFGAGIHNTLEAAAFSIPVIFGPRYEKFKEAKELIALKAGFAIENEAQLKGVIDTLISDKPFYKLCSDNAGKYVNEHTGATDTIVNYLKTSVAV